jgi:steroid delta-isomerase-like uncharacterized protein
MYWVRRLRSVSVMDALQLIEHTTTAWNNRDLDAYLACYADDCEILASGFEAHGHTGVAEFWTGFMEPFPDNTITIHQTVGAHADVAVEEGVLEGTHSGPLAGANGTAMPATGRPIRSPFAGVHTVRDGKIVSSRFYSDQLDFLQQLGALPEVAVTQ